MSIESFWTSRILVICACALLVYSFVSIDGNGKGNENGRGDDDYEKTTTTNERENRDDSGKETTRSPRLVFMVIDAFRLSFLTSPESSMTFTKSSISNNSAHLFDTYARMPTVTLPRITAYITGTLPSFGTILTNLATDEIKIDNWISRLHGAGNRIHFFGDDTWIRLLPGKFEKFDGVTSFFVNDFTEVDGNVTRHLNSELSGNEWDILILHYLGLDHIGHSLGGNSEKIPEKLKEMDGIVERIQGFLEESSEKNPRENYLIVCGDHGMTAAGSHGGASPDETRVPVVIWKIGGKFEQKVNKPVEKIEQIDVSATIFDLFGLRFPVDSYGISLAEYFRDDIFGEENLKKQHEHFKNLVKEKRLQISDICEDKCDYSDKFVQNSLKKWFRNVQEELIGTASEVPNRSIFICVLLLIGATILSIRVWIFRSSKLNFLIFLVNIINFASSLIEEEHEIWFYLGSTVVPIRAIRWIKNRDRKEIKPLLSLAFLHRIAFGYMQSTRRRWSMDPELLPKSLFSQFFDRDVEDLNTVLKLQPNIVLAFSFIYWLIYIKKNHSLIVLPIVAQYLRSLDYTDYSSQIYILIRLCVIGISCITGSPLFGFLPILLAIVPVSQVLLAILVYRIGNLSLKLNFNHVENLIFFMSSFFYFGNSNSLSTLSLTSAYVGLQDYYPILVGAQLVLYTFAGPTLYLAGRYFRKTFSSTNIAPSSCSQFLQLHFSFRISALATSLICLYIFQNHLFVWSVYSPKVVYDMAHVIFVGVISAFS